MRSFRCISGRLVLTAALAFAAVPALIEQTAFGQATTSSGAIQGTISDPRGAILPGAMITITNVATGAQKALVTDSAGLYTASSLVPGQYQITATAPGFSKLTTTVTVQIGTTTNGNLKLALGNASEEVVVSSEALEVNTTQSTVEGVLTEQQIDNLPISGRNFLDLSQLEPGVQLQSGETFDPTKAGYSSISFNGVNGRTARIMLDGQDISDETVGTTTLNVSQGSIEEFQISRSSLDISNELTSSGAVTVSTRSGTNSIHGQGFYLFRDLRSGAAAAPGGEDYPFQRNQMGGRLGAPILKDKLFFFGSAERVKQDSFNAVQELAPFAAYGGGYNSPFRDNYYVNREDYNLPHGIHTFFRIAYEDNLDDATYGYGYSRYGNKDNTPAFAGGADFASGRMTHSVRVSYLKFHNLIADESASGVPNLAPGVELFIHGLITGPNLLAPQQTYQSDKQFRYDATATIKSHIFNFGVSLNRILGGGFASFFGFAPELSADFAAGPVDGVSTGNPTAYSTSYLVMGNGEGFNTEKAEFGYPAGGQGDWRVGIYFGDTWKVNPRLTVNYGVRYSRDTGRSDSDLAPIPCSDAVAQWGALSPCTTGNLFDALQPGLGAKVRQPNEDWGPKVGFAYDLRGDGKTVIRGGAGLYYENNIFNNVLFDRPGRLKSGLFWSSAYVPGGSSSVALPDGSTVTTINGQSIASLWGEPISESAPYFAALQALYQSTTKKVGASANPSYVGNSLASGGNANGDSLYTPEFQTPRSYQINIGVQRQVWKGGVFSGDYIRNVGLHFMQSVDLNHVGDAKYLNTTAATNAITTTLNQCGVVTIAQAIMACPGLHTDPTSGAVTGATIADFASNGLDSGNAYLGSNPAGAYGYTPDTGAAFPGMNPLFGTMHFNKPLGRSLYNGLQLNLRQQARLAFPGVKNSNLEVSYALSRFVSSGGSDQNFTPGVIDENHPLSYIGPAGTDRTHQLSFGGTLDWVGHVQTSIIGHYYSALPTNLYLDTTGNSTGEIFMSDLTGDGTTGDLLPGLKAGAWMRSVKPRDLTNVINNYNAKYAGQLTPAGQALVGAGLFTADQLSMMGAVARSIAAPPTTPAGNGNLRTFDLTLGRPIKLARLGESASLEPSFSAFNLFNFSNYNTLGGNLANFQQSGTANGTDTSFSDSDPFNRNALRLGNGSGVFSQGASRVLEYGLKLNF